MSVQLDWTTSLPSTSSAEVSPVRISPTPAREPGSRASVPAFGANTLESFASFDPASLSWRTSQRSLLGGWETFSETWPRSGMMRSGIASAPVTSGRPIEGSGCSLWPTATAGDHKASGAAGYSTASGRHAGVTLTDAAVRLWPTPSAANPNAQESLETWQARREELKAKGTNGNGCGTPLGVAVRLWPTPTARDNDKQKDAPGREGGPSLSGMIRTWPTPNARDYKGPGGGHQAKGGNCLPTEAGAHGRSLNPAWVESLMGFPPGWTDGLPVPAKNSTRGKRRAPSAAATTEPRASKPLGTRSSRKSRKSSARS